MFIRSHSSSLLELSLNETTFGFSVPHSPDFNCKRFSSSLFLSLSPIRLQVCHSPFQLLTLVSLHFLNFFLYPPPIVLFRISICCYHGKQAWTLWTSNASTAVSTVQEVFTELRLEAKIFVRHWFFNRNWISAFTKCIHWVTDEFWSSVISVVRLQPLAFCL